MGYDMYRLDNEGKSREYDPTAFLTENYHRLNIWGMGDARDELLRVGVVKDVDFPHVAEDTQEGWEALRLVSPGDGPGIPVYKFGSNDGWVVNPTEVASGVAYADKHHPGWREKLSEQTREFVEWMEASPTGFEVW